MVKDLTKYFGDFDRLVSRVDYPTNMHRLVNVADRFLSSLPLAGVAETPNPDESLLAARLAYADMKDTFNPATLLGVIIVGLNESGQSLVALDEKQELGSKQIVNQLAQDVRGAFARAKLALNVGIVSGEMRKTLYRELEMAPVLIKGIVALGDNGQSFSTRPDAVKGTSLREGALRK